MGGEAPRTKKALTMTLGSGVGSSAEAFEAPIRAGEAARASHMRVHATIEGEEEPSAAALAREDRRRRLALE